MQIHLAKDLRFDMNQYTRAVNQLVFLKRVAVMYDSSVLVLRIPRGLTMRYLRHEDATGMLCLAGVVMI